MIYIAIYKNNGADLVGPVCIRPVGLHVSSSEQYWAFEINVEGLPAPSEVHVVRDEAEAEAWIAAREGSAQ